MHSTNLLTDVALTQKEIESILDTASISDHTKEKLQDAIRRVERKHMGIMALCALDDTQKDAICAAVDIMRHVELFQSSAAREAALWWIRKGRAIILQIAPNNADEHTYYGLEIIPADQHEDMRPGDDGFSSLNLGWFLAEDVALLEAEKLGLTVVAVE